MDDDPPVIHMIPDRLVYAHKQIPLRQAYSKADDAQSEAADEVASAALDDISEAPALDAISDVLPELQFPEQPSDHSTARLVQTMPTQSLSPKPHENFAAAFAHKAKASSRRDSAIRTGYSDTQSSNTVEMKDAFLAMMRPEQVTQGDTQTQAPFYAPYAASETTASPSRGEPSPLAASKIDQKFRLSHDTVARLDREMKTKKRSGPKTRSKGSTGKNERIVACQCAYAEEEGEMVLRIAHIRHCIFLLILASRSAAASATPGSIYIVMASPDRMTLAFQMSTYAFSAFSAKANRRLSTIYAS